jgi:hypothetical protein
MRIRGLLTGGAVTLLAAGCARGPKAPAVAPSPPPPPAVESPLPPPPLPAPVGWEDTPLTPGDWRFASAPTAAATYGEGAAAAFSVRCDVAQRRVLLIRPAATASSLTIRTTFGTRQFPAGEAALAASDSFLDGIVSSRGRFAVETPGLPALILPTWPEPARVVEECRP